MEMGWGMGERDGRGMGMGWGRGMGREGGWEGDGMFLSSNNGGNYTTL